MGFLKNSTLSFLGGLSVKELASWSDEIQNLNNRLLAMTGTQVEATKTLNDLTLISRETNQSLNAVSDSYFRMSQALRDANVNQQVMLDVTKTIANTFRLSGASTQEAANATIQLGQAFSLGVLRGQDLRSVMSQNVVLTRLLRQEFGTNLLKAAEQGLITVPKLFELLRKNMSQVNDEAALMSTTFEQGTVKALDALKLKIFELNQAVGASSIFNKGIDYLVKNMGEVVTIGTIVATVTLPALASGIYGVATALGLTNPLLLVTTGLLASLVVALGESRDAADLFTQLRVGFNRLLSLLETVKQKFYEARAVLTLDGDEKQRLQSLAARAKLAAEGYEVFADNLWKANDAQKALNEKTKANAASAAEWAKSQANLANYFKDGSKKEEKAADILKALNAQYTAGAISIAQYNEKILEARAEIAQLKFDQGKADLGQRNDALDQLKITQVNQAFAQGKTNIIQFSEAVNSIRMRNLKEDLDAGRISVIQFNQELAKVQSNFSAGGAWRAGLSDYVQSIGTTTQEVGGVISRAFSNLEDVLLNFTKTGKFEFNKFAEAILDDLTRVIIRTQILKAVAGGFLGGSTAATNTAPQTVGGGGGQYISPGGFADGGVFDGGLKKFAGGGIVSTPTMFGYGSGKAGLMGEAGPEAILPLDRGPGGRLGVTASVTPVNITIINQSGNEVQQSETTGSNGERMVEILITGKVREGIASGKFDRAFKNAYGINRKGS